MMMGFGGIGLILMVIFWGVVIFGGAGVIKSLFNGGQIKMDNSQTSQQPSAREILDQRYARGEISQEEYKQIKADL